jgi:hypothetical protein
VDQKTWDEIKETAEGCKRMAAKLEAWLEKEDPRKAGSRYALVVGTDAQRAEFDNENARVALYLVQFVGESPTQDSQARWARLVVSPTVFAQLPMILFQQALERCVRKLVDFFKIPMPQGWRAVSEEDLDLLFPSGQGSVGCGWRVKMQFHGGCRDEISWTALADELQFFAQERGH